MNTHTILANSPPPPVGGSHPKISKPNHPKDHITCRGCIKSIAKATFPPKSPKVSWISFILHRRYFSSQVFLSLNHFLKLIGSIGSAGPLNTPKNIIIMARGWGIIYP